MNKKIFIYQGEILKTENTTNFPILIIFFMTIAIPLNYCTWA